MRTMILGLVAAIMLPLCSLAGEPAPRQKNDAQAMTIPLDKIGNAVSVAREGRHIHLMTREATVDKNDPKGVTTLFADGGVMLTRRQALRLTELLDDAIRDIPKPDVESASNESPFRLCSSCCAGGCLPGMCGPGGCPGDCYCPQAQPTRQTDLAPFWCWTCQKHSIYMARRGQTVTRCLHCGKWIAVRTRFQR